jgi:DNA-directed RNA polymerase specialized sigma24 family protein
LLGFAIKIIQQMKRHHGREAARADYMSFDEVGLVDRLHGQAAQELLSLVSESDQQVLRLAVIEGLSGRELAVELGITEGAARVRLHRAKQQLRRVYSQLL